MMAILYFGSFAFLVGVLVGQAGGILNLFDFDEGWIKKQNAKFKKVLDLFFK